MIFHHFVIFQLLIAPYTFDISIGLMLMSSCPDSCALLKSSNEAAEIRISRGLFEVLCLQAFLFDFCSPEK